MEDDSYDVTPSLVMEMTQVMITELLVMFEKQTPGFIEQYGKRLVRHAADIKLKGDTDTPDVWKPLHAIGTVMAAYADKEKPKS